MKNRFQDFAIDLKDFVINKENKLLREEIDKRFKYETDYKKIIDYLLLTRPDHPETYYYIAKLEVQNQLHKLEMVFAHCTACMFWYCEKDDDIYILGSPALRQQLDIKYGVAFGKHYRYHAPYLSITQDCIIYLDHANVPEEYSESAKEACQLYIEHGYLSSWLIPFYIEDGTPIGSLGLHFDYQAEDLLDPAAIEFIRESLNELENNFRTILLSYDKFKDQRTKKIL